MNAIVIKAGHVYLLAMCPYHGFIHKVNHRHRCRRGYNRISTNFTEPFPCFAKR